MNEYKEKDIITASQIWAVLIWAAQNKQSPLLYKDMAALVGRHWEDLSAPLAIIKQYCKNHNLPILTVLVVQARSGKPSTGLNDIEDISEETTAVYEFVAKEWDVFWEDRKWSECESKIINPGVEEFAKLRF